MERTVERQLDTWLLAKTKLPLILRGARQTGKTWLVRNLAQRHKRDLFELNFERDLQLVKLFNSNDPRKIVDEISIEMGRVFDIDKSILFLDEIQAAGEIISKLRWFAEELPQLSVVSAGSLLEFTLANHNFSMPVGRVKFIHVEPMGFGEFLIAHNQKLIYEKLNIWKLGEDFSPALHKQAQKWYHRYTMVGGMPAIVQSDISGSSGRECRELQRDISATYRADFSKYSKNIPPFILDHALQYTARSIGSKFIYSHINKDVKQHFAKRALELLASAKVCHLVRHSSGNGVPLGGEVKDSFKKVILTDVGLFHALTGTPAGESFPELERFSDDIRGRIAEQVVGQHLRLLGPFSGDGPELFYWQREGGRPGEIDYLIQHNTRVIPVEVKSGTAGKMKSLHQFMYDKKLDLAVRFDGNEPRVETLSLKTTQSNHVSYKLISLPWYMAEFLSEILER